MTQKLNKPDQFEFAEQRVKNATPIAGLLGVSCSKARHVADLCANQHAPEFGDDAHLRSASRHLRVDLCAEGRKFYAQTEAFTISPLFSARGADAIYAFLTSFAIPSGRRQRAPLRPRPRRMT